MKLDKLLRTVFAGLAALLVTACSVEVEDDKRGEDPPQRSAEVQPLIISESMSDTERNTVFFNNVGGDFSYSFDYRAPRNEEIYSLKSDDTLREQCAIEDHHISFELYELEDGEESLMYRLYSLGRYLRFDEGKYYRLKVVFSDVPPCGRFALSFWTFSTPM